MSDYSKVFKELSEIFKYIPEEQMKKIPDEIIKRIEEKKDNEYNYEVIHIEDFQNQNMLKETRAILAVLYRDYWASEEERKEIKEQERLEYINTDNELSNNNKEIFIKNDKKIENEAKNAIIVYKESFIRKIIKKIMSFFK